MWVGDGLWTNHDLTVCTESSLTGDEKRIEFGEVGGSSINIFGFKHMRQEVPM